RDDTDPATTIWLNSRSRSGAADRPALCYGGANTWAKAIRGAAVADCLSVPLILSHGQLAAAPATDDAGWALDAVARIAASRHRLLQLDGRHLPPDAACAATAQWLSARSAAGQPTGSVSLALGTSPQATDLPSACQQLSRQGVSLTQGVVEITVQQLPWRASAGPSRTAPAPALLTVTTEWDTNTDER